LGHPFVFAFEKAKEAVLVAVAAPGRHGILLRGGAGQGLARQGEDDLEVRDFNFFEYEAEDLGGQLEELAVGLGRDGCVDEDRLRNEEGIIGIWLRWCICCSWKLSTRGYWSGGG
jgi:hypothetical protein